MAGSVIQLYCKATSVNSTPNVTWLKNSATLVNDPPHIRIRSTRNATEMSTVSSLVVDNFGLADDNGSYACQANDGTRSTKSSSLSFTGM